MFDDVATGELVEVIAEAHRRESALIARQLAGIAELLGRRTAEAEAEDPDAGYMIITGLQRASAEIGAAMNLSAGAASLLVSQAEALDSRFPKVAAVLAEGRTDWPTVQVILARSELVSDLDLVAALDTDLAGRIGRWHCWSRRRMIRVVDAAVRALGPDAIREREQAEDRRNVEITTRGDGTAKLDGVLTAKAAVVVERRLTELAEGVCRHDPRSVGQRRADALAAMAEGRGLSCRCERGDCTVPPVAPSTRFVVHVVADRTTLLGDGHGAGMVAGFGVVDAEQARELADGATIRPLAEPVGTDAAALIYQPSAALERWVRLRDITCRFPGCDRGAELCDIDHTVPFDHHDPAAGGRTVAANLKCLCRQHHRLKTFIGGWRDEQLPDGTVIWVSPTGVIHRTTPGIVDVFPRTAPSCCAPAPVRRRPARERASRIRRLRERNRVRRPINAEAARVRLEHRRELGFIRERNAMRRRLRFFKGGRPSRSPYCTWINDPYEVEELPPDWQPPPLPEVPEEPPF